jgi:two-component system cell cycle response regulator
MPSTLHDELLRWSNELLATGSLEDFAGVLTRPPAGGGAPTTANLMLVDGGHELRHLAAGDSGMSAASSALHFVEGLGGVAPYYDVLRNAWSGPYHAADHGLLFDATAGVTHVMLLPLPRDRTVNGVFNIAGCGGMPELASLEPAWLTHVAGQIGANVERLFYRARLFRTGVVDPLSGWNSGEYLRARAREEVARSHRHRQPATCLIVDVDMLRAVNERYGVPAGDRALSELGARIESQVRGSDATAHLGSDAFGILLPATSPAEALPLAKRIMAAVRATPVALSPGLAVPLTVSIGIAALGAADTDDRKAVANEWLAAAEGALHAAKREGGNCWVISRGDATAAIEI